MTLKQRALRFARDRLSMDIYRRNCAPWGEEQLWTDVQRLVLAASSATTRAVAVDVGAYRGGTIDRITSTHEFHAIHAFEPFPASFAALERRFGGATRVYLHNLALSDAPGEKNFHLTRSAQSNSLLPPLEGTNLSTDAHHQVAEITVATSTLDAVAYEYAIDRVTLLKLDVQGAELAVLNGAIGLLDNARIDVVVCEVEFIELYKGQPLFSDISGFALSKGLTLFGIYAPRPDKFGRMAWAEAIFCREAVISMLGCHTAR